MTRPRTGRRGALALLAVGIALALGPVAAVHAQSQPDDDGQEAVAAFGSFTLRGDASGVMVNFRRQGAEPTLAGMAPYTQASLGTGPTGYALASMSWPGPTVANGGTALGVLLPTCAHDPAPPGICTPGAPPQSSQLNWPVRAEAFSPLGPNDAELGPAMQAHAKGAEANARAALEPVDVPGVVSIEQVTTTSRTIVENGVAVAEARTVMSGIELGDGAVTIDAVTTVARADTDGKTSSTAGATTVEGLEINGQKATVDEHGVHFASTTSPNPVDAIAGQLNEQMFSHMGAELFVTRPVDAREPGAARYSSGNLVFVWEIPESGKYGIVVSLGGASAQARARPAGTSLSTEDDDDLFGLEEEPPLDEVVLDRTFDDVGGGYVAPPAPLRPARVSDDGGLAQFEPASSGGTFGGVAPGLVVVSLLGTALTGFGMRRLFATVLAPAPVPCSLERTL